jgi:8-oxo-dGTP diphosphatase
MTTTVPTRVGPQVYLHEPTARCATAIGPSVFVAVRGLGGRLLLVHRCASDAWEFPGGPMDVGESATESVVRQTAADAGLRVLLTGIVGIFSDPSIVVPGPEHQLQQQFAVLFRARSLGGVPHGDLRRTSEAAWVAQRDQSQLAVLPAVRDWIVEALANESVPCIR